MAINIYCNVLENVRKLQIILCYFVFFCSNSIDNIIQVEFLALCQQLNRLTCDGNPICVAPHPCAADVSFSVTVIVKELYTAS